MLLNGDIARSQHMRRNHAVAGETLEAERFAPQGVRYNETAHRLLAEVLAVSGAPAELRAMATRLRVAV